MLTNHRIEERPWGSFEQFTAHETSTVKILRISANSRLSLQTHAHRSEYWQVIEGSGIVQLDQESRELAVGDMVEIPVGTAHRLEGGPNGISVLEIALGDFDENDITRLADDYGRAP